MYTVEFMNDKMDVCATLKFSYFYYADDMFEAALKANHDTYPVIVLRSIETGQIIRIASNVPNYD